ncbi:MAG: hypothetical protein NTW06_03170 [Candidatus Falkowbacteria bacterium]|nr:hypothetical protein [Candidatus Falkowbacteria bacterium]
MSYKLNCFGKLEWTESVLPDFTANLKDGSRISSFEHSQVHLHEFEPGLGIGHLKDQFTGEKITTVNTFNKRVNAMLPDAITMMTTMPMPKF